jgi:foldase protein PrsA
MSPLQRILSVFKQVITNIRIAWIKWWALQRRFAFDHTSMSFRRALTTFLIVVLGVYFVIGLPVMSYLVYGKKVEGTTLATAATLYPLPVATVGGDVILLKPYADRLAYLQFFAKQTQQTVPQGQELRDQVIKKLIDEAVIRQWANREGITVSNDDIDAAYDKIIQDRGNENAVKTVLSQLYNLDDAEFKRLIPDLLYREKIEKTLLERAHVKHILVSTESLANKVRGEVDGSNFGDKAKQYSEDKTTRDSGGELGFFDRGRAEKLSPELAKVFFELQPGQISGPVKSQYGYHLIYLVEKTGKEQKTFEQWLEEKRGQTKIRRFLK